MSLPPTVIRVKRKRVEETPVTFLHIDEGTKRHRSDSSHWVYKRRGSTTTQQPPAKPSPSPLGKPQIRLSPAVNDDRGNDATATQQKQDAGDKHTPAVASPRRFRVSKAMLAAAAAANSAAAAAATGTTGGLGGGGGGSISKRDRYGTPTLFVERTRRKKLAPKPRRSIMGLAGEAASAAGSSTTGGVAAKDLKRPGVSNRSREIAAAAARTDAAAAVTTKNPLPASLTNRGAGEEDMAKIAADMNDWVMREVGANLQSQEAQRKREAAARTPLSPSRFRPKAPAQRYHERHPDVPAPGTPAAMDVEGDTNMTDASEDEDGDDDDWVIEEYIRIPANSVALDVSPADVGVLVLEGEEESLLFFGPQNDEDEDWDEDEEDENAENHYTADYPEDEVDSEDEFNRNAYYFRNNNVSDDEEYDQDDFDGEGGDDDDDGRVVDGREDDDDARMTRILEQMKRLKASQR